MQLLRDAPRPRRKGRVRAVSFRYMEAHDAVLHALLFARLPSMEFHIPGHGKHRVDVLFDEDRVATILRVVMSGLVRAGDVRLTHEQALPILEWLLESVPEEVHSGNAPA